MSEVTPPSVAPSSVAPPSDAFGALPQSTVAKRRRISLIWIIPIVTLLIAGYLAWDTLSKRGPTIEITITDASGLVAGQTQIQHRGIRIGIVTKLGFIDGATRVVVTAQMTSEADPLVTQDAKIWLVQPRLFAGSISGLGTLVSGSYFELLPGADGAAKQHHFVALSDPPVLRSDVPGQTVMLASERIGSISVGSPVFFRDMTVGEVLGWDLGKMARSVTIHAFVRAPFDQYLTPRSRFWNASGVSVKLGAEGVQVQFESLKAVVLGGVAFENPDTDDAGDQAAISAPFQLFADHQAATDAGYGRRVPFVAYFSGSVDGLADGSVVTFQGLRVGQVTGIGLQFDPERDAIVAPVHFLVEPDRIANFKLRQDLGPAENVRELIRRGLRAQLKSTNLLTGQMSVALEIMPNAPPAEFQVEDAVFVMPTAPNTFEGITQSVNGLLTKLNTMPFDQIGKNLDDTLHGASRIANSPELAKTIASLQSVATTAQQVLARVDAAATPALKELPAIARQLETALTAAGKTLASLNTGYGESSKFSNDLNRTMVQLSDAVRSIRVLADLLARHPEALIQGRTDPTQP